MPGCLPPSQQPQGYGFTLLCLATGGISLQQLLDPLVCCLEHSSIKTPASGEPDEETPAPALRPSSLQSWNVGRKLMLQRWPFSRICESDRLLLCLKEGLFLHEKKKLISCPVEIRGPERHQMACNVSSSSRDRCLHHGTTKAAHSIKRVLEKFSGQWQIMIECKHASGPNQPS